MRKNLIVHLWPGREHGTWRRTVQHLVARWDLFDQHMVSVVTDETTDSSDEVFEAFGNRGFVSQVVSNDRQQGEGATFGAMLQHWAKQQDGHTFYCHSKGSSHPPDAPSQRWADLMFHLCLDYPSRVERALRDHSVAGSCKRVENRMGVPWHYSGTFFWFNNHRWLAAPKTTDRNCVERWPAENFAVEDAADLGMADPRNLYDEINWRSWVTMRFRREVLWDQERVAERAVCPRDWMSLPETEFDPLKVLYLEVRQLSLAIRGRRDE